MRIDTGIAALAWAREQRHPGTLAFALRSACRFIEFGRTDSEPADGGGELCTLSVEHHLPHWAGVGRVLRGQDLLRRGAPVEQRPRSRPASRRSAHNAVASAGTTQNSRSHASILRRLERDGRFARGRGCSFSSRRIAARRSALVMCRTCAPALAMASRITRSSAEAASW